MKNKIYRITENDLHQIIKKTVCQMINEQVLDQDENFTPYKEGDGEKMRKASLKRSVEDRNPAYAKALKAAQERKSKKSSMEEGINEIGDTKEWQYKLGQLSARQNQDGKLGGTQTSMYAQRQRSNAKDGYGMRASFQNGQNAFHNRMRRQNGQNDDAVENQYGYYNKEDFGLR